MLVLKKCFPNNNLGILAIVRDGLNSTSALPQIKSFLLSRLEKDSFFADFLYYNRNIHQYIASFGERYIGLLDSDIIILRNLLETYTKNLFLKSSAANLFDSLLFSFEKTCSWKQMKYLSNGI